MHNSYFSSLLPEAHPYFLDSIVDYLGPKNFLKILSESNKFLSITPFILGSTSYQKY